MSSMPLQFRPTPVAVPFDSKPNVNLALAVKPWLFDSAGETAAKGESILAAQQLRDGRAMDNELARLKLDQATGEAGALDAYRTAAAAGDPNALDALAGYPEMASEMRKAIDAMSDADREAAHEQTLRLAAAAAKASVHPEGSLSRTETWRLQIEELHRNGDLDDDEYEAMKAADPTDELIEGIFKTSMSLDEAMAAFMKERAGPQTYEELPLADKLKIDEEARKRAEAGKSEYGANIPPEEMQATIAAARADILREYGLLPPEEADGTSIGKGGKPSALTSPAPTATNPETGEKVTWNGSAWVPVK